MSEFRIDQIKNQAGISGPNVAGITTFTGTSGIVMPSGTTAGRFAKDFISEGLVFYVDISLKECYNPGISSTVYDPISGITDDEVTGSPTFSAADNDGPDRLVFDGEDDGILFDRCDPILGFGPGNPLTISVWAKIDKEEDGTATIFSIQRCNSPSFQIWVDSGSGAFRAADYVGRITWRVATGDQFVVDTRTGEEQVRKGELRSGKEAPYVDGRGYWINVVGVYYGTTAELYINGKLSGFNREATSSWTTRTNPTTGSAIGIMRRFPCGNSGFTNGEFNHCAMYRRALSSQEILHNYNVLKGRFGL